MTRRTIFGIAAFLPVGGGLGYAAWHILSAQREVECKACQRPVHAHSRTIATVDGTRGVYCCPACAMSERLQTGHAVEILELTDYATGKPLPPAQAILVRNSEINPCLEHQPHVGANKQPLERHFDRCLPGILAFSDRTSARKFVAQFGGEIFPFSELAGQPRQPTP